ncbi:YncE family protein [Bathymodiolus thermophilus thioautotrophic gill symbiont]|nr:hypothetical protein [Bathymodiolus thermophilus thioautotrophic gill symbiont]
MATMTLLTDVPTNMNPYPVDKAGNTKNLYVSTRNADSIDIINSETMLRTNSINLSHKPRSAEAYNESLGVVIVAGADKPMSSIIDPNTNKVVATAGENTLTVPSLDYGGTLSSGHPFWFTDRKFAVIDRENRSISLWKIVGNRSSGFSTEFLNKVKTPTSVHSFVGIKNEASRTYYAIAEGSPDNGIPPMLLEIKIDQEEIFINRAQSLYGNPEKMGSHHADLHPDGRHIYVGSTQGYMYVINRDNMGIVNIIKTGLGSAHTTFIPKRNLAIVTNHKDTFVTIINTETHKNIKNITVSTEQEKGQILQSHTSFVDADENYFYSFATDNGTFYELDLKLLDISRTLHTGGTPKQGVFVSIPPVFTHIMNRDISIDIKPIQRTTGHPSSAFIGGDNTINAPTNMVWSSGPSSKFSTMLNDESGKQYEVYLVANVTLSGCQNVQINSAMTCEYAVANKLNISFDATLNTNIPVGTRLTGQFSLKRLQWPNMNTTNTEIHNFEVNWKVPPL